MKAVLRAVLARFDLFPAYAPAESTRRRGITFSPAGGATVVLRARRRAPSPPPAITLAGA
ncbi:MAG TPA: hypothetical protein VE127_02275 [Solirubrobacteraceae bacterium]|nr:hypothetical protein [Solirubrobacteraceae bacterium]